MRLYNGCPDSELQAKWDREDAARKRLPPGYRCTYFPVEGKYLVCDPNYHSVGDFAPTIEAACDRALIIIKGQQQ